MPYVTGERRDRLRQEVANKYKLGKSIRQIAEELNYSYGAAHALLKQAGVQFRERGYRA